MSSPYITFFGNALTYLPSHWLTRKAMEIVSRGLFSFLHREKLKTYEFELLEKLKDAEVLLIGPGLTSKDDEEEITAARNNGILIIGIGWTPLIRKKLDFFITGHSAHMLTTFTGDSAIGIKLQAIPNPIYPVYRETKLVQRVNVVDWADSEIANYIIQERRKNDTPLSNACPTFHNAMFLGIFFAMMNGAKKVSLYGFDPLRPVYAIPKESRKRYLGLATISNGLGLDYLLHSSNKKPEDALVSIRNGLTDNKSDVFTRVPDLTKKMQRMFSIANYIGFDIDLRGSSEFFNILKKGDLNSSECQNMSDRKLSS